MRPWILAAASFLALLAGPVAAQDAGDRVLAAWPGDGLWYPGRIQRVEGDRAHVAFDDGDFAVVTIADVHPVDWGIGSRLQCNWQNRGHYYDGTVEHMDGENLRLRYDDGEREAMTISRCRSLPAVE